MDRTSLQKALLRLENPVQRSRVVAIYLQAAMNFLPRLGLGLALAAWVLVRLEAGALGIVAAGWLACAGVAWACINAFNTASDVRRAPDDIARQAMDQAARVDRHLHQRVTELLRAQGCLYQRQVDAVLLLLAHLQAGVKKPR